MIFDRIRITELSGGYEVGVTLAGEDDELFQRTVERAAINGREIVIDGQMTIERPQTAVDIYFDENVTATSTEPRVNVKFD